MQNKTEKSITFPEARKLIQSTSQVNYAAAVKSSQVIQQRSMTSVSTQTDIVDCKCKNELASNTLLASRMDTSTETSVEVSESGTPLGASGETPAARGEQQARHLSPKPPSSSAPSSPRQLRDRGPASSVSQKPAAPAGGGKGKSVAGAAKPGSTSPRKKIQYP